MAAWGLPGARSSSAGLDRAQQAEVVHRATTQRLLGPLLRASAEGGVELDPDLSEEAQQGHAAAMHWCLLVERRYLDARRWFDAAGGVRHVVVKGPAIAHMDEDDPAERSFADLDLLVDSGDLETAVAALQEQGGTRRWAERRPGFDRRFAKSVTITCADGMEVDLHRSLCDGVHGFRIPLERLLSMPDHFELAGTAVPALGPVHRLLHSAYHAVLGSPEPRLMSLRDLARYLSRPDLDPSTVQSEVRRWRGEAVLAAAVRSVTTTLAVDLAPWATWLEQTEVSPTEARLVEAQRREGSKLGPGKLLALRALPWSQRPSYALALALPSRAHLASRGLRRRDLARRALARRR